MFGFNWVDIVIIALLIAAAWRGMYANFWSQLLTIIGLFTGLFLFGWLSSHVLKSLLDPSHFPVVNANLVLLVSAFLAIVGNSLGYRIHINLSGGKAKKFWRAMSVTLSVLSILFAAWLMAGAIGRMPFEGLSNSANDALIVQLLDRELPPPPAIFALLDKYVDPNNQPRVFVGSAPAPGTAEALKPVDVAAVKKKVKNSVVRITSFGCGSIVTGSGFVVAPQLVATNAHVIAGVRRPIVKLNDDSYEAVPIYFDSKFDIAILRVKDLKAPPLMLATENIYTNSAVVVLGYPGGNFSVVSGVIMDRIVAYGRDIYDIGLIGRDLYTVQMDIGLGSSGGPIVLPDGRVAGMVFAKSDSADYYGFALTASNINLSLEQLGGSTKRVGTGVCDKG